MKTLQEVLCLGATIFLTNCGDIFIDEINVDAENSGDLTGTVNVEPIAEDETVAAAEEEETIETTDTAVEDETITTEGTPVGIFMDEEDVGKVGWSTEETAEPYENIYFDLCNDWCDDVDDYDCFKIDYIRDVGPNLFCNDDDSVFLADANKLLELGISTAALNAKLYANEYYIITAFEYEYASEVFEKVTRDSELRLDFCIVYRYYADKFDCPDKHWEDVEMNSCQLTRMNGANLSDCLYQEIREYFE